MHLTTDSARSSSWSSTGPASYEVAVHGAKVLGFTTADIALVVQGLERKDFYKSMTCFGDHTIWQDVYHATTRRGLVYLKLSVVEDLLIVSFKEL